MGQVIAITGASGFIGRACVAEARARGLNVLAIVRDAQRVPDRPGVEVCLADLAGPACLPALTAALSRADCLIHAASALSGDAALQQNVTISGTRRLAQALRAATRRPRIVVLVSSISVYDPLSLSPGGRLSEATPLETQATARDPYVHGKLMQEEILAVAAQTLGLGLWLARPGAVFGPGRLWNGHLGLALGPLALRLGHDGEVPVSHVAHCASALVTAALTPPDGIEAVNIVDDDRPGRVRYLEALAESGWPRMILPLPWGIPRGVAAALSHLPPKRLPGLLRPAPVAARLMPLRYDNALLAARLGWRQVGTFEDAMARSLRKGQA